jgi:hypothetical protein
MWADAGFALLILVSMSVTPQILVLYLSNRAELWGRKHGTWVPVGSNVRLHKSPEFFYLTGAEEIYTCMLVDPGCRSEMLLIT